MTTTARTVLVTGAAGFVGRHVVELLARRGWQVTGVDRLPPQDRLPAGVRFCLGDLLEDGPLPELDASGFDAVVHLAGALPGPMGRGQLFAVNVGGTAAVLERFAHDGCHVVLFSTGLVYGRQPGPFVEAMSPQPVDPYAQSKLAAEALAVAWGRATGSPVTVLRPSVIYGAGAPGTMLLCSLMQALRAGQPFAMTAGEQLRDFLHVEDAALAVAAVLEARASGVWNLASGESRRVRDVAALGAEIAGRPELLRLGVLPYRAGEVFDYRLVPTALATATGWRAGIALPEGLARLWKEAA
jgi:UDP-glucose 4-epimerase